MRTRWNRLQDGLAAAGISAEISRRGRDGGEFIEIPSGSGTWISIHERFAYGNWAGWVVDVLDREGFGREILRQGKTIEAVVTVVQTQMTQEVTS
jgi:hypothetical protein